MALIIDAPMPKGCCWKLESGCFDICKLRKVCGKGVSDKPLMTGYRHRDCPIIGEIPDKHGRLIDADAIISKIERIVHPDDLTHTIAWSIMKQIIAEAPTVLGATK